MLLEFTLQCAIAELKNTLHHADTFAQDSHGLNYTVGFGDIKETYAEMNRLRRS